ncbi:unnamed protein product [Aureobasidium vineae]|uniref:Myb-like domain-containing protein n=1 Tax=Aureobasidium vineae TaxID=2773715 RepID=A0A9N8JPM6_9PEZI|nr:unnamed protein product [Aureobasidium vineae]
MTVVKPVAEPSINAPNTVVKSVVESSIDTPVAVVKPDPVVRKARRSRAARGSMSNELVTSINDSFSHETRVTSSRSGTPKGKAADETWLTVQSRAPVHFPAEYHGLLTSLSQVQSIKPPNWLEIGVEAEGIDQLPEPDRIIAAAMSWNAEDYAQTKCTFFNQYDPAMRDRNHWRNTLKFGGSKSKEKAERLLAMWESLGWLEDPEATPNNAPEHRKVSVAPNPRKRTSFGPRKAWSADEIDAVTEIMSDIDKSSANLGVVERARMCNLTEVRGKKANSWSSQEEEAMLEIMDNLEKHPAHEHMTIKQRAEMCQLRLKTLFGTDRTSVAVKVRYNLIRRNKEADQMDDNNNNTNASANDSVMNGVVPVILRTPLTGDSDIKIPLAGDSTIKIPLVRDPVIKDFTPINHAVRNDLIDSADPNASSVVSKIRWNDKEDKALLEVFKEIEQDSGVSTEREKLRVCSARLLSRHNIKRSAESIRGRWERLNSSNNSSNTSSNNSSNNTPNSTTKRKRVDISSSSEGLYPLKSRTKRSKTETRFVTQLFDAGEERIEGIRS